MMVPERVLEAHGRDDEDHSQSVVCKCCLDRWDSATSASKSSCTPKIMSKRPRTAERHVNICSTMSRRGKEELRRRVKRSGGAASTVSSTCRSGASTGTGDDDVIEDDQDCTGDPVEELPPPKKKIRRSVTLRDFGYVHRELTDIERAEFIQLILC